jgi:hypothetical protein
VNVGLPAVSGSAGRVYQIVKTVAANNVVVDPSGVETINGAANYTLYSQYESGHRRQQRDRVVYRVEERADAGRFFNEPRPGDERKLDDL